ncbi:MAG: T9SS type A sorting domain-containing protein [Bacteroidetes bacterium]|nr:MAG: T9SS type A sorting domain-containing protein [Bacteroidota bacterium]
MKIALLSFLMVSVQIFAQEFSFQINFEDAAGYKDSLIVGYDSTATNNIDSQLGEVDYSDSAWSDQLEVRFGFNNQESTHTQGTFKNWFAPIHCGEEYWQFKGVELNISTLNWPVKMTWNVNVASSDECGKELSLYNYFGSPTTPGTSTLSELNFSLGTGELSFTSQKANGTVFNDDYPVFLIDDSGHEISRFYLAYHNPWDISSISELKSVKFNVSPNPTTSKIRLKLDDLVSEFTTVSIYSLEGKKVLNSPFQTELNVQQLPPGFYTISITDQSGKKLISRFVKE